MLFRSGWVLDVHVNETTSRRIYYAGDTALFSDMQWTARKPVDLLIVPIGDLFTMGVEDSIEATRFLHPKWVMPTHYDTWPPIAQDAVNWGERIRHETEASPIIPAIDASWTLPL